LLKTVNGTAMTQGRALKKILSLAPDMAKKSNFSSFYIMAILVSLGVAVLTKDKYIGVLLGIALCLWIAGIQQRRNRNVR
jgi:branched-subunit amino acid transport protein